MEEYVEIITNLKEKITAETASPSDKILLLSVLPKSWSARKISEFCKVSRRVAAKVKTGMSNSGKENRRQLPQETVTAVAEFYKNDENSRIMPGMNDTKCVKGEDGVKVYLQKRLLLYNLRELYLKFKDLHAGLKIGVSKFAEIRPPQCVFAGSSGTHNVCVCVYHQNVKLMLEGMNISKLTSNEITNYKDCIAKLICDNPSTSCYLNQCKECPGIGPLATELRKLSEEADIERVEFNSWFSTDRATLQVRVTSTEDFLQELGTTLIELKTHSFIGKEQSSFFKKTKESLTFGQFLVSLDYAENYAFTFQDAAQRFHYNNDQCSIATVVIYWIDEQGILQHQSLAILSDNLTHDTASVYCLQEIITNHVKKRFPHAKKTFYFSDGATQHFKNRFNFENLLHHADDFSLEAEWHFHVTAHGKNACDGIGAIIKSTARRESLQKISSDFILTPMQLYE
ncbi:hypothetical protein QAD02_021400 [Eretmocerus hayati]|uniref:Uncharacterized protein n=1 Tax=Eretmocerus hayati TaxID=131215 RepID=A0ACC2PQD1_9HYME|nr:hypothetical protein QAD02_021400 [Eretmocerus hayati]